MPSFTLSLHHRAIGIIAILGCLFHLCSGQLLATTINDDFSRYIDGSTTLPTWDIQTDGFDVWTVQHGSYCSDGQGYGFAIPKEAVSGKNVTIEAVLTFKQPVSTTWKAAGLTITYGTPVWCGQSRNFWRLAAVERPGPKDSGHFIELIEMLDNHWMANKEDGSGLPVTVDKNTGFSWQYNHPYKFSLKMTPAGITGTVSELDGTVCSEIGYAFKAGTNAITVGRPALSTEYLATDFDHVMATMQDVVPEPQIINSIRPYTSKESTVRIGKKTGFFHVEQINNHWWMIDPNGQPFYAVSTDHANYYGHMCEKLGYAPYHKNVLSLYPTEADWVKSTADRLHAWGFNALGTGCDTTLHPYGFPYAFFIGFGTNFANFSAITPKTTWTGFPNVFHPRFAAWCDALAQRLCAQFRNDPWLTGYYLDNELQWFGSHGTQAGMVDDTFTKPADNPAKQALITFLRERHKTIANFNHAWGTTFASFDDVAKSTQAITPTTDAGKKDQYDFVRLIAERYFSMTTAAIRKVDPNHMIMGCRFAGTAPDIWDIVGKYVDVVSVNFYGNLDLAHGKFLYSDVNRSFGDMHSMPEDMTIYNAKSHRPIYITEWCFLGLDSGLPCSYGAGQRVATQTDRARSFEIYQKKLFALPFMVGSNFFMWVDEPALAISSIFPEDGNYGLVDINDRPWPQLTAAASRINPLVKQLHAGLSPEINAQLINPAFGKTTAILRLKNTGKLLAACPVRIVVQGNERLVDVQIASGATKDIPISVPQTSLISVDVDPDHIMMETDESDNHLESIVKIGQRQTTTLLIVNYGQENLQNIPVTIPVKHLGAIPASFSLTGADGKAISAQIDQLPGGDEMTVIIPELKQRSVATLSIKPGVIPQAKHATSADAAFTINGKLRLTHDVGSRFILTNVELAGTNLGFFTTLIQQNEDGKRDWIWPTKVEKIDSFIGPIRSVYYVTTSGNLLETTFRVVAYPGEQWYSTRFVNVKNTSTKPWTFEAYFHRPESRLGGGIDNNRPVVFDDIHTWYNDKIGLMYGGFPTASTMRIRFWKEDATGEHPDISRGINQQLAPGQSMTATTDDGDVILFGCTAVNGQPDPAILTRLRAMRQLHVEVVIPNKPVKK
ncbi:MAG TPA: beta-galactosidase [Armatimonadota bacterium]|nr:beta-galactosidase [Armatimonadota bacterium]